jgi:hypothetical protein
MCSSEYYADHNCHIDCNNQSNLHHCHINCNHFSYNHHHSDHHPNYHRSLPTRPVFGYKPRLKRRPMPLVPVW